MTSKSGRPDSSGSRFYSFFYFTLVSAPWKSFLFTLGQNETFRTSLSSAWVIINIIIIITERGPKPPGARSLSLSLSSEPQKEAAWPRLLIFSRLGDA